MLKGELKDSHFAPILFDILAKEKEMEPAAKCDLYWLTTAIRLSDEYFEGVRVSAGIRDWQRDFAVVAVPLLVGATRTLERSADAQSFLIKLCNTIAAQLRLTLIWPNETDQYNDLVNAIYRACVQATELESDDVLLTIKSLEVIGPK
ncbi:MAG: hypothetical protein IT426_05035 [Pirellulales bacterium]|nr:hypothetical protein [Pirellulales bacterium]